MLCAFGFSTEESSLPWNRGPAIAILLAVRQKGRPDEPVVALSADGGGHKYMEQST